MNHPFLIYLIRRLLIMIPTLLVISVLVFIVIELPPGDYVTSYVQALRARGYEIGREQLEALRIRYGLDEPFFSRYLKWMSGLIRGDLGMSFTYAEPVTKLIGERIPLTIMISLITILFTWLMAIPIGIISAVKKYSLWDYLLTFIGFIGLSIPNFFLAIILMYLGFRYFGVSIGGLFSREFLFAPWSWAKFIDMLSHLWVPVVVIGTAGTAGMIRVLRATLLDELSKDYVRTARSKGLSEFRVIVIHPLRVAINPLISTVGWLLPTVISGEVITSQVLSIPTTGPLLLGALLNQDMYLAGSFLMVLSVLTVVGTLLSDILLAWLDPRITYS
jgi:peptide/nickel transport system permease protein